MPNRWGLLDSGVGSKRISLHLFEKLYCCVLFSVRSAVFLKLSPRRPNLIQSYTGGRVDAFHMIVIDYYYMMNTPWLGKWTGGTGYKGAVLNFSSMVYCRATGLLS